MRLLICAGGTGGGVYPAVAVLKALASEADPVLWVGSVGGLETDLVKRANIPYTAIPAGGVYFSGRELLRLPGSLLRLARGYFAARRILRQFKPDVLLFTGGYVAAPVAFAGRNIPSVVYIPDIEPGLALKSILPFADRIAVTTSESNKYLGDRTNVVVTGYPTRPELAAWDPASARAQFNLEPDLPTLLVSGGSRGARSINQALLANLPTLMSFCQVIHLSGSLDWPEVEQAKRSLGVEISRRYHPYPYLHEEMGAAYTAADLVVSRAGASTLGEYPLFGLPAILVPYPYTWRFQRVNAAYLETHGAAVVIEDSDLAGKLAGSVTQILRDPARLEHMRAGMRALATPDAADQIAGQIRQLARKDGGRQ